MTVAASFNASESQYGFTLAVQCLTILLTVVIRPYQNMLQNVISIVGDLLVLTVYILLQISQDQFEIFAGKVIGTSTAID